MRAYAALALVGALLVTLAPAKPVAAAGVPTWTVDKAHSKLGFDSAYGPTQFSGSFGAWTASIAFDPANPAASKATVTVDLASAKTGDEDRDQSLPSPDWFYAGKFPKATFTTTAIKSMGGDKYQAAGVLNLKGISKPATLNFSLQIKGDQAVMNGQATLDRTHWNVGEGQFVDEKPVPHAVVVTVALTAHKGG
jgi:polyisoprenoid-binding protein YceI